jgi:hypothetical protein
VIHFEALVEQGMVAPADLDLFSFVESAEDAWAALLRLGLPIERMESTETRERLR